MIPILVRIVRTPCCDVPRALVIRGRAARESEVIGGVECECGTVHTFDVQGAGFKRARLEANGYPNHARWESWARVEEVRMV